MASLLLAFLLTACRIELLANLSQRQANETIALLQRHGIDTRKTDVGKGRFKVEVDKRDFAEAVGLLERNQLPSKDNLSIADLFPTDSLVNSPAAERARLISGLEQRLEQTLRSIDRVLSARVHVSYPITDRADAKRDMHVSVLVNYDGPLTDAILIQRLKQLVKNSFDGVSYDNVSIVVFPALGISPPVIEASRDAAPHFWQWLPAAAAGLILALGGVAWWAWRRKTQKAEVAA